MACLRPQAWRLLPAYLTPPAGIQGRVRPSTPSGAPCQERSTVFAIRKPQGTEADPELAGQVARARAIAFAPGT